MKLRPVIMSALLVLSTAAFAEDRSCNALRILTKAQISEHISKIKDRVNADKEEMFNSDFVQNALKPDAHEGKPYKWIGDRKEHDGYRTYMNIYRSSDMFPRDEIRTWSGGEKTWSIDASPDVAAMSEMINSLRSANGLSRIEITGVTFSQDLQRSNPLELVEIDVREDQLNERTIVSAEELSERYLLPRFCRSRFANQEASVSDASREENKDTHTFSYSSSSTSSVRIQRSSSSSVKSE